MESETITDVLGYANTASFQTIGSPSRPMPSISFTPATNAFVNTSLVKFEAQATDPYTQVKEVKFEVNLSGVWTPIGSDTCGPYWKYRWDASSVPDGVYDLRASAFLLGGEGTTVTNSNIMLDRTLPTYISSTITPLDEPYVGVPVEIEVTADDEDSGVDHIDVYARKVYDSAVYGEWNFIGSIPGSQGGLVWDTSGYSAGTYQIAFSIQDKAGNWGPDSQPELLLGLKGKVFLPVILKGGGGPLPTVTPTATPTATPTPTVSTWTQRSPVVSPSARKAHEMAYDSARGVSVLFGGEDDSSARLADTWEWNGTTWSQPIPSTSPPARYYHALAYDSARHVTVLFGGNNDTILGDTWEWNGTTWTQRTPPTSPPARWLHAMAYDSTQGVVVLFGGSGDCGGSCNDTWEWNGTTWSQPIPSTTPPGRWGHDLAYDSARGVTVLFGGRSAGTLGDTWEWNGTTWIQRIASPSPPDREDPTLVYDSAHHTTVLFGGYRDGQGFLGDTWEWNGTTWTNTTPSTSPSARGTHAVAYDSARGVTVMFGGYDGIMRLADTWEYVGGGGD